MLARFEVENFKSFDTRTVFDLSEIKNYEFNSECIQDGVIDKALMYGMNGCGKSNLGLAIFDISAHLTDNDSSHVAYQQNYLHADLPTDTAKFKYVFKFGQSTVEYRYEKRSLREVVSECLFVNGVQVVNYDGRDLTTTLKGAGTLKTNLTESKISALKYIKSNAVLDIDETNDVVSKFFDFVDRMLFFRTVTLSYGSEFIGYESSNLNILEDIAKNDHIRDLEQLLNDAGVRCTLTMIESNGMKSIGVKFKNTTIPIWEIASTGTKPLILFYFWMQHLVQRHRNASLLFIDEFDANYHHELAAKVIQQLKTIDAQVILTTHDTTLMTNDLLRPDCCFVMNDNKIDPLYKLTSKELRFAHNIEKMYRAGSFHG